MLATVRDVREIVPKVFQLAFSPRETPLIVGNSEETVREDPLEGFELVGHLGRSPTSGERGIATEPAMSRMHIGARVGWHHYERNWQATQTQSLAPEVVGRWRPELSRDAPSSGGRANYHCRWFNA